MLRVIGPSGNPMVSWLTSAAKARGTVSAVPEWPPGLVVIVYMTVKSPLSSGRTGSVPSGMSKTEGDLRCWAVRWARVESAAGDVEESERCGARHRPPAPG